MRDVFAALKTGIAEERKRNRKNTESELGYITRDVAIDALARAVSTAEKDYERRQRERQRREA